MGFVTVLAVIFSVGVSFSCAQVDLTIVPETSGTKVVKSVVSKIQLSGIFLKDHSFLSRIAFVESKDGTDSNTYRAGYGGGIWQVDLIAFQATKDVSSHPALVEKHKKIKKAFNIDWSNVQWMDLRKPLYSGIAARLFLSNIKKKIPLASDIMEQGKYWKKYYNTEAGKGTAQKFVNDVSVLESERNQGSGCTSSDWP